MKDDQDLVESLLAHEEDVAVPADHERRIREGLGALLGAAPVAPAKTPAADPSRAVASASDLGQSALRNWVTTGIVAVVAAGGGFAIGRSTAPQAPAPPSVSEPAPPATTATATATVQPPASSVVELPVSVPSASMSVTARPPPSPSPLPATDAFDREQSLLERARSALVRHDADAAEKALDEHDRQFPRSRHIEERDYLRIQVLRERGDTTRVRERAKAFLARYPDSMLRARVEPLAE